jgi:hypothetical protein
MRQKSAYSHRSELSRMSETMESIMEMDQLVGVGKKVVRGQDWKDGNNDGGRGNPGIVLEVCPNKQSVTVKWEITNHVGKYKYGGNLQEKEGSKSAWKPVYEIQSQVAYNAMTDIIGLGAHMPLTKLRENRSNKRGREAAHVGVPYPDLDEDNEHNGYLTFINTS